MTRTLRRIILAAVAIIALLVMLPVIKDHVSGFGSSDRSTATYCDTWKSTAREQGEHYNEIAKNGSLTEQLQLIMGMPGDMAEFYGKMDKIAPAEIEPDIARAQQDAKDFDGLNGQVPNDLSGLGSNFGEKILKSLTSTPTQKRIHDWNAANCPNLRGENSYYN
jgi:hypothetical protein